MNNWQEDFDELLIGENFNDLTNFLIKSAKDVPVPDVEVMKTMGAILNTIALRMPQNASMWVSFYLGAAWQKGLATD